ncbi:hypothetical protein [Humibacter sp. RRB41]|uniref:hypothetical protein n=1 Tax=Humibacter sp. RRB41 TaxID=2919946 RepID=UPI001FAA9E5C|nr:hypothetical protein [Humibacter sp. RRB41]
MVQTNRPKPVRYDLDTWLVMRNDPVVPKAVIQRVHHREGDRYLLFRWDLDPKKRELMNVVDSLARADELVKYDVPAAGVPGPPNGRLGNGEWAVTPKAAE